jgi:hypothetical protein
MPLPRNIYLTPRSAYSASDTTLAVAAHDSNIDAGCGGILMSRGSNDSNAFLVEKQEHRMPHDGSRVTEDELRQPRLSLFLTVILLLFVTVVSR